MPSRLLSRDPRGRYFRAPSGVTTEGDLGEIVSPRVANVREPLGGYVPDIDPALLQLTDAEFSQAVVARGGILGPDDGWDRVSPDTLPLAGGAITAISIHATAPTITCAENHDVPAATTFEVVLSGTDSTPSIDGTYTATRTGAATFTVPATTTGAGTTGRWRHIDPNTADGEPVIALIQYFQGGAFASANQIAVTGSNETSGGTVIPGHVSKLVGGNWTLQPYDGIGGVAANQPLEATEDGLCDWTYHVPDDLVVFCNPNDAVYRHPGNGGSDYGPLMQLNHDFDTLGAPGAGVAYAFKARSVESFGERLVFLNTEEDTPAAGTVHRQRFRYSVIGPSPLVGGNPQPMSGQGSGFIDLHEFGGEGLRAETLGNVCAAYFSDGVAFMRRTLNSAIPFTREYITKRRGALGTFSITPLSKGVHFVIATDGWFLLDSTGRWTELGVMRRGNRILRKWMDTFYTMLDYENRNRVVCEFDRLRRMVSIGFPDTSASNGRPNNVWHYDVDNDRVWPDLYPVNCWGQFDDTISAATTWAAATGSWEGQGPLAWQDFAGQTGLFRVIHGTTDGLVLRHASSLFTRDGAAFTMIYHSHESDFGLPPSVNLVSDKVWANYVRIEQAGGGAGGPITLGVRSQGNIEDHTFTPNKGDPNTNQMDFVGTRLHGQRLGIRMSTQAPNFLNGFQFSYLVEGTEPRKA